jgi:hypothetical protein
MAQHVAPPAARHVAEQVADLVAQHVQRHHARHAARLVVYTALLGGDRPLREAPVAADSSADFVCFTDDPGLRSATWQVIPVEPRLPTDLVRSERHLKIVGHPALDGYDRTLWVDNAVELLVPPETFVDDWLENADVASPVHTLYRTVLEEAEASVELGRDDHLRVFEQLAHYLSSAPTAVETNPHWTALLARRRTPRVEAVMTTWWEHVLRFSRRDQLSFSVVMAASGLRLNSVALPNLRSPLHLWPEGWETRAEGRTAGARPPGDRAGNRAGDPAGGRHLADAAALRTEIEEALGDGRDPHAWVWDLEARMAAATDKVRRLRDQLETQRSS